MGGLAATVVSCTNEEIKAQVPDGFAGVAVTVTRNNRQAVSEKELLILAPNTDISSFVLINYKQPFTVDPDFISTIGEQHINNWSTPAGWVVSDNVKTLSNDTYIYGGLAFDGNNTFLCMQYSTSWAGPATKINNGKMYQVIDLPKGK